MDKIEPQHTVYTLYVTNQRKLYECTYPGQEFFIQSYHIVDTGYIC